MGFASGSISFRRFAVVGTEKEMPEVITQDILDRLAEHIVKPPEFGVPDEIDYGWNGGRHIYDNQFTFDRNVFNDALTFALRIDTNRVPADVKRAHEAIEEDAIAASNPSGFISKQQKRTVKDLVRNKLDDELRSGKYRRSKLVPILWDVPGRIVYCSASGSTLEKLLEIFERTFGLNLEPLTAGSLALRLLETHGKRREYEDTRPTRFVIGPDGDGTHPEYPWTAKGPEPKDFFGNEFMVWLWHEADGRSGVVKTESAGEITVLFDRSLDLDCAYGQTGRDSIKATGPSHSLEARDALRVGKVVRKAGLVLNAFKQDYNLTLSAESLAVGGAKLPDVDEADTPRKLFEERIALLRDFSKAVDALFAAFLKVRASSAWESHTGGIRKWILQTSKPMAAVA
jgi:hypothetical protein